VEAYKWYPLAAIWDDDAAKDREEIAERMSFADIKKAQHLAEEWLDQREEEGTQTHPIKRPLITY